MGIQEFFTYCIDLTKNMKFKNVPLTPSDLGYERISFKGALNCGYVKDRMMKAFLSIYFKDRYLDFYTSLDNWLKYNYLPINSTIWDIPCRVIVPKYNVKLDHVVRASGIREITISDDKIDDNLKSVIEIWESLFNDYCFVLASMNAYENIYVDEHGKHVLFRDLPECFLNKIPPCMDYILHSERHRVIIKPEKVEKITNIINKNNIYGLLV